MIPLALVFALSVAVQASIGRTVLATVFDPRNQPTVDLEADDFVVREGGQPREILSARVADYPVLVLIDNSEDARDDFEAIRSAALRFITRIGQRPVAVGTLGGPPEMVASFDDDRGAVLEALPRISVQTGHAQLLQAVAKASQTLRALEAPFSAIIVLSTSNAEPVPPSDWLTQVLDSHAIVHVIDRQPPGAAVPNELRTLTAQTRGQLTTIFSSISYEAALDRLADQMATEMMIDYLVPGNRPLQVNDVTVGVRFPGARVQGLGVR